MLCTIGMPFGRSRFLRPLFGIAPAPNIFELARQRMIEDLLCVPVVMFDIPLSRETKEAHYRNLTFQLTRCRYHDPSQNLEKYTFLQQDIRYLKTHLHESTHSAYVTSTCQN